jgi:NADH-quinone oxidoreductase subunit N
MLWSLAQIGTPFLPSWDQLRPFLPELWLIGAIVAVLIVPFWARRPNAVCGLVALAGVILALCSLSDTAAGEHFRGLLVLDGVAMFWKAILLLFVAGVILMAFGTTLSTLHEGDGPEFFTLLLGATLGMCLMASTSNLLMIFMSVELASLPSYVLAGFRKTHRLGAEASLKYVLFGAACSAVMVYGLSLLYGLYGTLQIQPIAEAMAQSDRGAPLAALAMLGLIVGIGFKISAVPFHFWCPDVFEGAGIDVTAFLSVASKGAGLVLLLRIVETVGAAANFDATGKLTALAVVIGAMGAITATVGNTAAFVQTNMKRLLAYSSIAHAGYMLCALSLIVKGDSADVLFQPSSSAAQALLLYLAVYALMNLGAFTITAIVVRNGGGEMLENFRGLSRRSPLLAACMCCCLISLIGLPPLAGFGAKVNLLWVLFQAGGWWSALIVVIAVNTVISAFYYFRVMRAMYLERSDAPEVVGSPIAVGLSVICAVALVILFIFFGFLSKVSSGHDQLFRPAGAVTESADGA